MNVKLWHKSDVMRSPFIEHLVMHVCD